MALTRAQKRMLLDAYCHPNFALYGAWNFRCARNLMNKGLVQLVGIGLYYTPAGEKLVQELLDKGSNKIED